MDLYAGDCPLEDTNAVLDAEQHYTVCHYMRCRSCGAFYFVGAGVESTIYRKKTEGGVADVYQKILGQFYWRLG